jgi:cytochrome P450
MLDYDPYSDAIMTNPYPTYVALRNESPAHYIEEFDTWFLSRFEDVWRAGSDHESFKTKNGTTPGHLLTHDTPVALSFNSFDPPTHTRMRAQVKDLFTPNGIKRLRPQIEAVTRECMDRMIEQGGGDLVQDFAARISITGAILAAGLPLELREQGIEWVNGVMHRRDGHRGSTDVGAEAGKEMFFYCLDHTKAMRKNPERATGVLHTLLTTEVDGALLDDFAVASTLSLVLIGGTDTFPKVLGATLHRLWQHPDVRREVAGDLSLARDAFLEALRLDTPTQMLGRVCVSATEYHGHTIEAGQNVMFLWAAANRDEREFADPDVFDIRRRPKRMLAFGQGTHMCLGHHFAKMEAVIALEEVLRRVPEYEIVEAESRKNRTEFVQGWTDLPAKLG